MWHRRIALALALGAVFLLAASGLGVRAGLWPFRFGFGMFAAALFFGLKAAVLAIVIEAVQRIGKRVLKNRTMIALAVASFIAIFVFSVPFPALIIVAAIIGIVGGRLSPSRFLVIRGHGAQNDQESVLHAPQHSIAPQPLLMRSIIVSVIFLTLWFGPLAATWMA